MTRRRWVAFQVVAVITQPLAFAAITRNPKWGRHIGLIVGALWGLVSWPITRWMTRVIGHDAKPHSAPTSGRGGMLSTQFGLRVIAAHAGD